MGGRQGEVRQPERKSEEKNGKKKGKIKDQILKNNARIRKSRKESGLEARHGGAGPLR